tara:strand:+ start:27 stop:365 length:339 start_codon:yes stop_codon:yes gene_type:complete
VEVLISRASMKQQMKGNRMKKKPVVKKNIGKILGGGLIPAIMGKKPMMKLAESGMGGILPMAFAKQQRRKRQKADMSGSNRMTEMQRMMAGGMMKRSRPIDGIATKGKTRAV